MISWKIASIVLFFTFGYLQYPQGQEPLQPRLALMCVSAHPDDEGGATLAYYARIKGVKAYSIFFTRGEGGQNEIGSELYEDLGTIRTKETNEAAKMIGSEVYFLGFPDFGYSKTAKETFARWGGKDSAIARLVYFIRALKPDVIITNHDTVTTGPDRQHGNHQAAGIAAYEAFERASDPSYHPEQLHDGVIPWQVKKLFVRFYDRDSASIHQPPVTTDVTQRDSSGTAVYDIALAALQKHRSQGMLRLSPRQRYYLLRQNTNYVFDNANLFSGIEPTVRETVRISDEEPAHHPPAASSNTSDKTTARVAQNIQVGLVKTYDDTNERILTKFHVNFTLLDSGALAGEQLSRYSAIVLDLRAYQYRTDALRYNTKLLSYVENGGNLVVFSSLAGARS